MMRAFKLMQFCSVSWVVRKSQWGYVDRDKDGILIGGEYTAAGIGE